MAWHSQSVAAPAKHLLLLLALTVLALAQVPEPNCNSNTYEGNEVWSAVPNFIGAGSGTFWWGGKAPAAALPVSWIDMCAKRLEVCQADSKVPGSVSGFKPTCACDMWSCLNRQPAAAIDARPACQFMKPQLLTFYCNAARFVNATCSDPAYVPLPDNGACPSLPTEGFTFDDMPGDGIRIPSSYQGLIWDNWFMLDGDGYQIKNGYYAGTISSPKVAFNGYGYPASFYAPEGGLLTLHSMYLTSAWDEENIVTIMSFDERGNTLGQVEVTLSTENPRHIDLVTLPAGAVHGTFVGVKSIEISTSATQIALDNLVVTIEAEPGRELSPSPKQRFEFWPAPPGASAPIRKGVDAMPEQRNRTGEVISSGKWLKTMQDDTPSAQADASMPNATESQHKI